MKRATALAIRAAIERCAQFLPAEEITDTAATLFPSWDVDNTYNAGERVKFDGKVYECVQPHTALPEWTPAATPALWRDVRNINTEGEEIVPEWVEPTGAHDAYNLGDVVIFNGVTYRSIIAANVYAPNVYGWEVVE